jgi:hypothetical protein
MHARAATTCRSKGYQVHRIENLVSSELLTAFTGSVLGASAEHLPGPGLGLGADGKSERGTGR